MRGLAVNRFADTGLRFRTNGGNVIEGNFIGTDITGSSDLGNAIGVQIYSGALNDTIGGVTPAARNIISGNLLWGVFIRSTGSLVQGNLIGTDITGTSKLGNLKSGVYIGSGSNNTVGGTGAGARNVISGNGDGVIIVVDSSSGGVLISATGNTVLGNFIGTDVTGSFDLGNSGSGVFISGASDNMIGGTGAGAGNVISGNNNAGASLVAGSFGNVVQGNLIGTDATGTLAVGNSFDGVEIENAPNNLIGGTTAGAGNVLSGNHSGIYIGGFGATGNLVQGNLIGTDVTGTVSLGNVGDGIEFRSANGNTVGGTRSNVSNTIAYNGGDGVAVFSGMDNAILSNSIFSNVGLGIDLIPNGVTLNDEGDGDTGANDLENFPLLSSAASGITTTIQGSLNSTPSTSLRLEFFSNAACDPTGYGEGENFLGSSNVTTDASGNASLTITFLTTVPEGRFITATATDPNGNTSEFSECVEVVTPLATFNVTSTADAGDANLLNGLCDDGRGNCTLRAAIEQAGSGDSIDIPAGTYTLTLGSELSIDKSLTLTGAGSGDTIIQAATSSADAASGVFDMTDGEVAISSVTIRHGNTSSGGGGGIRNQGTLLLTNTKVSDNVSTSSVGGGIWNIGNLTLISSTVRNNAVVDAYSGGIFNGTGMVTLVNSTVSGNISSKAGGIANKGGEVNLTDSRVSENIATISVGGGIWNINGTLTLINSAITDNTASGNGGGVNNDGTLTLTDSTVSDNRSNGFLSDGGGIWNNGALTLTNSTVSGNTSGQNGGGIFNDSTGTLDLTNSTVSGNTTRNDGGGIYNTGGGALTLANSTLSGNTAATTSGGGIYNSGTAELVNTIIANSGSGRDCIGILTSFGYNLIGDNTTCGFAPTAGDLIGLDPKLGPLTDNGGPTLTHALLPGSPAIDAGDDSVLGPPHNLTTDQRGEPRRQGAHVDIGAYELEPMILVDTNGDGVVDTDDLRIVTASLNTLPPADPRADVNGDGKVDIGDLVEVAINFGRTAP